MTRINRGAEQCSVTPFPCHPREFRGSIIIFPLWPASSSFLPIASPLHPPLSRYFAPHARPAEPLNACAVCSLLRNADSAFYLHQSAADLTCYDSCSLVLASRDYRSSGACRVGTGLGFGFLFLLPSRRFFIPLVASAILSFTSPLHWARNQYQKSCPV
jgi:hypothetical protein